MKGFESRSVCVVLTVSHVTRVQLALYVLTFLGPRDLLQAAQTCRYWRILAEDNLLWREKCREEGKQIGRTGNTWCSGCGVDTLCTALPNVEFY
ncbi:F-box/WD repeat-containing protein 7 [Liparis tanakae]|uniref:F-box/WD repeat-containing protein 7 n=1 Tax=Liparis tanakae TaxID=230148 RepID=A0A4Z2EUI0_9TELE|nr:F-box/WD repeat-containing protein 7 [Liparis tanakae]